MAGGNTLRADVFADWQKRLRKQTEKELARYGEGDWVETIKCLLGDTPNKLEAAILMIHFEMRMDPTNENLAAARKYLTWALQDIVKAQAIAKSRL